MPRQRLRWLRGHVLRDRVLQEQAGDRRPQQGPADRGRRQAYAGCYVNAVVEFWAQDDDNGKRINCALGPVQFFKDGPAFAGGKKISANEAFDDLGDLGDEDEAGNEFL